MFERFTDRARRVVVLAQEEARMLNHNYIGTEHILLGLIHEGEGVAAKALESLSISLDGVREQVQEIIGQGQQAPSGHIPFTPRAKKVLELSLREALQLGHNYIGTEHILLGLIREGEGVAAQVLVKLGADLNRVRQQVIQLLSGYQGKETTGAGVGPGQAEGTPAGSVVLDQFGRNLTQAARENKLDPVIGRESEMERVMQVLSRRTKNNPVLIGEPASARPPSSKASPKRSSAATSRKPSRTSSCTPWTSVHWWLAPGTAVTSKSASKRSSRKSAPAATSSSSSTRSTPSWVPVPLKVPSMPRPS
ncbi:ATP-dependent Clp protease ATP-binding subunit ClpC1 [Arthrobacter sp. Hiyo4]|nr:ATP-dependent Clp protease ATP-binding subunit ClpC1 [Arthrobacter sp. Hiyo4]